jgi:hypothetical protein
MLYYKKISANKYLIFSYFNPNSKKNEDGFDCWIANFKNEKQIGVTLSNELNEIDFSCNSKKVRELIKIYAG